MESEDAKVELSCVCYSPSAQTPAGREGAELLQRKVTLLHYTASRSESVRPRQWARTQTRLEPTVFIDLIKHFFGCAGSLLLHRLFSSCGERGLLFVGVQGLLIVAASLVSTGAGQSGFSLCSIQAQALWLLGSAVAGTRA